MQISDRELAWRYEKTEQAQQDVQSELAFLHRGEEIDVDHELDQLLEPELNELTRLSDHGLLDTWRDALFRYWHAAKAGHGKVDRDAARTAVAAQRLVDERLAAGHSVGARVRDELDREVIRDWLPVFAALFAVIGALSLWRGNVADAILGLAVALGIVLELRSARHS